jgi:FAD/FMN-containing dehydrogenase
MPITSQVLPASLIEQLSAIVGPDYVKTQEDDLAYYGKDWTTAVDPMPGAIVLPNSTEQVQALVKLAITHQLKVVPSGGRTGLSGGAVAFQGELVIALDRINHIQQFNEVDRSVQCGAGVITEQLQQFASEQGYYYPVNFASSGSSQLGGNISTNAGGIKVIRYGMTREWVLGMTLVTGAGDILHLGKGLYKNNTGYDLMQLFIGGEGTLGLITEITMKLTTAPKALTTLVLGIEQLEHLMPVMTRFRRDLELTAFEFFSDLALSKVVEHSQLQPPFESKALYYALIEYDQLSEAHTELALSAFEDCMEAGWVIDGVISQNEQQAANLWRLREDISETIAKWTPYKNDLSVKPSQVPAFLTAIEHYVTTAYPDFERIWFGHIGDGNLHLNILKPETLDRSTFLEKCETVTQGIFEIVATFEGSVSAEHGVGLLKKPYLQYSRSQAEIELMKALKRVFDPHLIMNPGKLFN